MEFVNQHILSVDQFDLTGVNRVLDVAESLIPFSRRDSRSKALEGAILSNIFLEPSTRTRMSFASAFQRLGGSVIDTTAKETTALAKGESLQDFARVVAGYCDVITMRHPEKGSVAKFANYSSVPVINGGDGENEHPTQALIDVFTIRSELAKQEQNINFSTIAVVGDLKFGRAAHSLLKLLALFDSLHLKLVTPPQLRAPRELVELLQIRGHAVSVCSELESGIEDADVLYVTRIQDERFSSKEESDRFRGVLRLNQQVYSTFAKPGAIILHPLPRDSRASAQELGTDLDQNRNLAIFRQSDNGIPVRMALFLLVLNKVN